ncbi:unnamed protein product [Mucor hiemalis]
MTPAALPLSMRNQKISQHFICASNEIKASEMLEPLVDDLVELEEGITIPILFINADNPRHADVSCTMRFCYWHQDDKRSARATHVFPGDYVAVPRNTEHLKGFLNNFIPNGFPLTLKDKFRNNLSHDNCSKIGYKRTGGDELLRLSSWNPSKDCPVEILHTLLLGIVKYTWNLIADKLLNDNQLKVIQYNIRQYRTKAFPTLNSSLFHYKSFLGRDYKITVQNMPTVLKPSFEHDSFNSCSQRIKDTIFNCFDSISRVTSMVYMGEIRYNYEEYLINLRHTVNGLITSMNNLDHANDAPITSEVERSRTMQLGSILENEAEVQPAIIDSTGETATLANGVSVPHAATGGNICNRVKTHLLVHMIDSVQRFGSLLRCETEKNEQFNSSIRGALIKSNRRGSSEHLCRFFGRIEYLQLIAMGDSWDYGRKTGGTAVKEFSVSDDVVGLYLSADRLFKENNHADVQKIVVGVSAIFEVPMNNVNATTKLIRGKVIEKKKEIVTIEEYAFVLEDESSPVANTSSVASICKKNAAGNFLACSTNVEGTVYTQVRINEVLDMSQVLQVQKWNCMVEQMRLSLNIRAHHQKSSPLVCKYYHKQKT